jgi:hypothetical protein
MQNYVRIVAYTPALLSASFHDTTNIIPHSNTTRLVQLSQRIANLKLPLRIPQEC